MAFNEFFNPKSIAIVGASRQKNKVGYGILKNILDDFQGKVFPVNQKTDSIEGIKCFADLKSIGEVP